MRSISGCELDARIRCSIFDAIVGETIDSPEPADSIPRISSWIDESLRR